MKEFVYFSIVLVSFLMKLGLSVGSMSFNKFDSWNGNEFELEEKSEKDSNSKDRGRMPLSMVLPMGKAKGGNDISGSGGRLAQFRQRRDQLSGPAQYKVPMPKNHILLDYGYSPRQLTSFAATNLLGQSQVAPNEYAYQVAAANVPGGPGGSDEDNIVAAGGHSHHGWGWSQGHGKGCNSALGLLGVLGLASYLQNVLRQMNGAGLGLGGGAGAGGGAGGGVDAGGKRMKRSSYTEQHSNHPLYDITSEMVPHLLHLNEIRTRSWPAHCSSQPVCILSRKVSKGLGKPEKELIKTTLKAVVSEILGSLGKRSELRKLIDKAATEGMKGNGGGKCEKRFKDCRMPRKMYKTRNNILF